MKQKALRHWETAGGRVHLYCGDRLAVMAGLPPASVDCVWTDPPYFLSNDGTTCIAGRRAKVNKGTWDRSRGFAVDHEFNLQWLAACQRVLKPAGTIWVSGTFHVYLSVGMAMQQLGFRILNDIIWEKPNPPPNLGCRCFTHATEILLWATPASKTGRHKYTFNYADMKKLNGGRQMKNVWRLRAAGRAEKKHGRHPTQKPVELIERCLRASTRPRDVVFDPFMGSGSTGVAALQLGCRFIGSEINDSYFTLACRRLGEISGSNND